MKPRELLTAYVLALALFLVLDAVWLSSMLERLYRPALGHLLAPQVAWPAAALFYLLYAAGIVGFAVVPALEVNGPRIALLHGAALGLLAYATYDLSNQATLPGWPWAVTLADLAWGTVATGLAGWGSATLMLALRRRRADAASIA
jgi:uncharacterized membrane protein